MRVITWNTGCAYGGTYKRSNGRAWQQVAAWAPDVALLRQVMRPPAWVRPEEVVFTPYDFDDRIGTAVWAPKSRPQRAELALAWLPSLPPQVTVAEVDLHDVSWLLASVHANTKELDRGTLPPLPEGWAARPAARCSLWTWSSQTSLRTLLVTASS